MNKASVRYPILIIFSLLLNDIAAAYPRKPLRLKDLTDVAEITAVIDVTKLDNHGDITVAVDGHPVRATTEVAEARLIRRIKGACPENLTINFYIPIPWVGYPGISTGPQLAFLKRSEDAFSFADPHYPSLPAAPGSLREEEPDPLNAVVAELGHLSRAGR
jgi:hypothetical protein